jgi:eukaryotic-like serine/threonine-protein kinase
MEKTAERRYQSVKAFIEALREAVGSKTDKPEITARAAAIFVEIRVADSADAESDAVLDDTSAILDATEQAFRGAGLGLPLQTGSAIIGARVLSDAVTAAAARDDVVALAHALANELAARPTAVPEVHVNISVHVGVASVKESAEAPDGKEIVGGDILSTADWAPQENVEGVHLTAAAG